jgi:hypothetical protein
MSTFWNYYFMRKYTENQKKIQKPKFEKQIRVNSKRVLQFNVFIDIN